MRNADQKWQRETRNAEPATRNAECGIRNAQCGIRTELCGTLQSAAQSAVRNAEPARGDVEFRIPQKYEPALILLNLPKVSFIRREKI